jgi:hypothetical protein
VEAQHLAALPQHVAALSGTQGPATSGAQAQGHAPSGGAGSTLGTLATSLQSGSGSGADKSWASGAKLVVERLSVDEARGGGNDKVCQAVRPKDHSKAVCEEAIAKVQEAAVETFDAKVRDWLLGGGGVCVCKCV